MLLFLVWRFEKDSLWKDENIASSFDTSSLSLPRTFDLESVEKSFLLVFVYPNL